MKLEKNLQLILIIYKIITQVKSYESDLDEHKQLLYLTKGKYHDGKGLYVTITRPGTGKWS